MIFRIILVASLFITGCVRSSAVMLDGSPQYAPSSKVEVFFDPPNRPYKKIALIEGSGGLNVSHVRVIEDMKRKAQDLGADAIIITKDDSQSVNTAGVIGGTFVMAGGRKPKLFAMAIKYE